jgi:SHS2 domain-containing protein
MDSKKPDFDLLDHTADLGIIVRGASLEELFEAAAKSMTSIMVISRSSDNIESETLSVLGADLPDLMVRWLGEILYLFEGEKRVLADVKIDRISPSSIDATLKTFPFDPKMHEVLREIKAVTYHQIEVAHRGDRWKAKVIFDL